MKYNVYFGSIGKTLGVAYQFTKNCKNEQEAVELAKNSASSLFYKYEGKYGLPSYDQIKSDSKFLGKSIEDMYSDYINYYMRWYVIPTSVDTIHSKKLILIGNNNRTL